MTIEQITRDDSIIGVTVTIITFRIAQRMHAEDDLPSAIAGPERGLLPHTGDLVPGISDQFRETMCVGSAIVTLMRPGIGIGMVTPTGGILRDAAAMPAVETNIRAQDGETRCGLTMGEADRREMPEINRVRVRTPRVNIVVPRLHQPQVQTYLTTMPCPRMSYSVLSLQRSELWIQCLEILMPEGHGEKP